MKKNILICIIFFIFIFVFVLSKYDNKNEVNYIGKTKYEIINLCANYERFSPDLKTVKTKKIMIGFNSGYHYFDSVTQALHDKNLMNAKTININFRYGRKLLSRGLNYYTVYFDDHGVVIKQNHSFVGD